MFVCATELYVEEHFDASTQSNVRNDNEQTEHLLYHFQITVLLTEFILCCIDVTYSIIFNWLRTQK